MKFNKNISMSFILNLNLVPREE